MKSIYLDNNATTKVDDRVIEAMLPFFSNCYGNPSASHYSGSLAEQALYKSREQVADLINAYPHEVYFTASGTEATNIAIFGSVNALNIKDIIISAVEHPCVMKSALELEKRTCRLTKIEVNGDGNLNHDQLLQSITDNSLVSIMYANNETGVIFPIEEIGKELKKHKIVFHVDAVQAPGKIEIDVKKMNVDLLSISGHKFYAPKGIGVLYIKEGIKVSPIIHGGGQERNIRPGTENIPYIVAIGEAAKIAKENLKENRRIESLRNKFEKNIKEIYPQAIINGEKSQRLPNTSSISFPNLNGEELLLKLNEKHIYVSMGSACSSGSRKASHVLKAMNIEDNLARATIRFSLSHDTTEKELDLLWTTF